MLLAVDLAEIDVGRAAGVTVFKPSEDGNEFALNRQGVTVDFGSVNANHEPAARVVRLKRGVLPSEPFPVERIPAKCGQHLAGQATNGRPAAHFSSSISTTAL